MESIKCKQIGQNMIVFFGNEKHSKKCTPDEITSIKNKAKLYEKKPTEALKKQIINLLNKKVVEKEVKKSKENGIKKLIKKGTKKVSKKKVPSTKGLVDKVETEFKEGNFTQDEIIRLEALLKKKKETIEKKAEVKQQDNNDGGSRERYR